MSEKDKLEYKERIKKLELRKIDKWDKLAGKIGVVIGVILVLLTIVLMLAREVI
jgi:archaellum biogenesis protein FlaJ (TadC family)